MPEDNTLLGAIRRATERVDAIDGMAFGKVGAHLDRLAGDLCTATARAEEQRNMMMQVALELEVCQGSQPELDGLIARLRKAGEAQR